LLNSNDDIGNKSNYQPRGDMVDAYGEKDRVRPPGIASGMLPGVDPSAAQPERDGDFTTEAGAVAFPLGNRQSDAHSSTAAVLPLAPAQKSGSRDAEKKANKDLALIPVKKPTQPQGKPFPAKPMNSKLSTAAWKKVEELFHAIDTDGTNNITKENARIFFKGAFGKLSTDAMFNEVDMDGSGAISGEEFASFWVQVFQTGLYKEEDILEELDEMKRGSAWVDWKDGRDTGAAVTLTFPKRPFMCRLSGKCWKKCEELFKKMDSDGSLRLTPDKARNFFKGGFVKVSAEAMFNEIDVDGSLVITADEWMQFWIGVKSSGYKEKEMMEEFEILLEGGAWRDWRDGRTT
jgi:Ca2+-binding EF-hand superfamily protein